MPGRGRGQGRFRRGWIESFVLLIIAEKPSHGYEIANKLSEFGVMLNGIGQMGNLYRTLAKLEEMGLVVTDWDTSEPGPSKKIYKITHDGMLFLENSKKDFIEFKHIIDVFIDRVERL
ncbi:PadR family transcriptional regulator [Marinitoga sp. 1135]|uniref:Putative transcriptional regulator n=1 Tax=Marinitoga piezophila (strain DSM 14283 / JCM 11233 / KA3) TaxID=443254 RepID=H2J5V0_MARPK|nr:MULTISPECIES: PadR family transcriptional regulator [Marinitoga]AEX86169.1 putative transcriptional regulator [Marinitoga piezophila KA3]APT76585.1 PadR family transcriptional regulator [Marinitoga sp. 1137]NUU96352.1 PadR family transcriptional regulator [Marinitoga sp. 1135]NUU98271.1 PadR family transcriptional regulator [Marinitoga sp. 1138]